MKRFIDIHIPVTACNLSCNYCYVALGHTRSTKPTPFLYDAKQIGQAMAAERWGGICHINMCGLGETLIPPQIVEITREILACGHYIMIVTNGTLTKRFEEFTKLPADYKKRLGFKFSYHYLELKEKGLFDTFYSNVNMMRNTGCSVSIEMTPSDELEPYIEEIKAACLEHFGAYCHVTIPRDVTKPGYKLQSKHSIEEFKKIWSTFDSDMFDFKLSTWEQPRKEYCYAGVWSGLLNIGNGELTSCYGSKVTQNVIEDPSKPINFIAVGKHCALDHCYNGHSLLALGVIPSIDWCHYCHERDRIDINTNTHWLTKEMATFLDERLESSNEEFSTLQKIVNELKKIPYMCAYYGRKGKRKLKKLF